MKKIIPILTLTIVALFLGGCSNQEKLQSNLDLQSKCSAKAKDFLDNYKETNPPGYNGYYSYENHYNSKSDKCYILIRGYSPDSLKNILFDAYENKDIAECEAYSSGNSMMNFCGYPGSSEKYDLDKFNNFIKQYMEN